MKHKYVTLMYFLQLKGFFMANWRIFNRIKMILWRQGLTKRINQGMILDIIPLT